ncbi:methyl-accepting chemotaxis protein [Sporosarcina sp. Sa2YVA2]|uniref:Methyl-accepting chemotaxis protein n=1 Tax=Sporosarcina quadrami TaxID=2762234 RepID=A0ABR8UE26_9BACL|nr:methyl-accepting chemotaxis protein [Sporosarcina quadrami]MBD7986288.1 methyl-accepting chemotaxis protein [Sporosarcina quadrami]
MALLKRRSIKQKLLAGFMLIIVLVTALGANNYISVNKVNEDTEDIIDVQVQLLIANTQFANSMANGLRVANSYILTGDKKYIEQFEEFYDQGNHYAEHMKNVLGEKFFDSTGVDLASEWRNDVINKVFAEYDMGNKEKATANLASLDPIGQESIETFSYWANVGEDEINQAGANVIKNGQSTLMVTVIVTVIVILLALATALITSNMITKPLSTVKNRMQAIADGDLSNEPLMIYSSDELGVLIAATNFMQENNRELLNDISRLSQTVSLQSEELTFSAREVMEGSTQMAMTMQNLSAGSESQADSANSLSVMMDTFTVKVTETDQNGQHIQANSTKVLELTDEGSQLMDSSTNQMMKIDEIVMDAVRKVEGLDVHSQKISELVSVIQSLAEQTNLLALNAAIEAARAGEHGKGFAVVAEEVRKLAEQSSNSVTNITEIVRQIQSESSMVVASLQSGYAEVEQGTEQIATTSKTFNDISNAVTAMVSDITNVSVNLTEIMSNSQDMTNSIQEIAAISEESAAGIEQSSAASQQIGSTMEEVSNRSKALAQMAQELNGLVGRFKL